MGSAPNHNSTIRYPSLWEHIDSQFPNSQLSQTNLSFPKRKCACIGNPSPNSVSGSNISHINGMPSVKCPYIEKIEEC